jgi:hypothetical protein
MPLPHEHAAAATGDSCLRIPADPRHPAACCSAPCSRHAAPRHGRAPAVVGAMPRRPRRLCPCAGPGSCVSTVCGALHRVTIWEVPAQHLPGSTVFFSKTAQRIVQLGIAWRPSPDSPQRTSWRCRCAPPPPPVLRGRHHRQRCRGSAKAAGCCARTCPLSMEHKYAARQIALWSPRLGRSVASAQLQPRPMIGVPYVATCAAALYAAIAMSRAVCGDAYEAGSEPPSTPARACCAYGTRASSTVRDAPGTVSSHDNACTTNSFSYQAASSRPG